MSEVRLSVLGRDLRVGDVAMPGGRTVTDVVIGAANIVSVRLRGEPMPRYVHAEELVDVLRVAP